MLVLPGGAPLKVTGLTLGHSGRFVDTFNRGSSLKHIPLGMGWTDIGELFPQGYDRARIHANGVGTGDPYWRGKNGAPMAPDDDWENYRDYPGLAMGGIGGGIRNIGNGIYNYDVTVRMSGLLSGDTSLGPESEATPLVGVNTASAGLGYGAWLVNIRRRFGSDVFVFLVGTVGNPAEHFYVTHVSGLITHTHGQQRDLTLKYRGINFTVWLDGVQITSFSEYDAETELTGAFVGGTIPVTADYQNKSWAGFEFDQHITPPDEMATTPAALSYSHQAIA